MHDMNVHRGDIHADNSSYLLTLGGVDYPFIAQRVDADFIVYALENCSFHYDSDDSSLILPDH